MSGQKQNWVLGTISGFPGILESALSAAISIPIQFRDRNPISNIGLLDRFILKTSPSMC
jgi:hypothetical protein